MVGMRSKQCKKNVNLTLGRFLNHNSELLGIRIAFLFLVPGGVRMSSDENRNSTTPVVSLQRQQELERYLKPRPADVEAYLELADLYRQQGHPLEARRTLKKGLEVQPDDPRLLWQFEEACLAQSLHQLREVTELTRRLGTGEAQRELERSRADWACRRVDVCRARLKRDPQNMQLRVVLAEALKDMGLFQEAIEATEGLVGHETLAPTACLISGQCYQALGEPMKALPLYRAAALRRAAPAPARIRALAMRSAMELAEQQGLPHSLQRYERFLKLAEAELQAANSPSASSAASSGTAASSTSVSTSTASSSTPDINLSELSSEGSPS